MFLNLDLSTWAESETGCKDRRQWKVAARPGRREIVINIFIILTISDIYTNVTKSNKFVEVNPKAYTPRHNYVTT